MSVTSACTDNKTTSKHIPAIQPMPFLKNSFPLLPLQAFILLATTLVAYYPAFEAGAIMDDHEFFLGDPVMSDPQGWYRIWFHPLDNNGVWPYLPITRSIFWLERQIVGGEPLEALAITHGVNVVLHGLSALILWLGLRSFQFRGAWWVGMLFALHPVYVQSVAWIAERKNGVAAIFFVLTLWAYGYFERNRSRWKHTKQYAWYGLILILFVGSLLSKTSTIMLPVLFLFCRLWWNLAWHKADVLRLLPFFGVAVAMGLVRVAFEVHHSDLEFGNRLLLAGHIPFFYISKFLIPYPLVFTYPQWDFSSIQLFHVLPLVSVACTGLLLVWKFRSWGRPGFLMLGAFLVLLFPVLGFFDNAWTRFSFVADHWVHLPSIPLVLGATAAVYWGIQQLPVLASQKPASTDKTAILLRSSLFGGILLLCVGLTWNQTQIYRDRSTLWNNTLQHNPDAWMAHYDLGTLAMMQQRFRQAVDHFDQVQRLRSSFVELFNNRGLAHFQLQNHRAAVADFNQAIQYQPNNSQFYNNRGLVYASGFNNLPAACYDWQQACRLGSCAYYELGRQRGECQ